MKNKKDFHNNFFTETLFGVSNTSVPWFDKRYFRKHLGDNRISEKVILKNFSFLSRPHFQSNILHTPQIKNARQKESLRCNSFGRSCITQNFNGYFDLKGIGVLNSKVPQRDAYGTGLFYLHSALYEVIAPVSYTHLTLPTIYSV